MESLRSSISSWIDFEKKEFLPETTYFNVDELLKLTRDEIKRWASSLRDEKLSKRANLIKRIKELCKDFSEMHGASDFMSRMVDILNYMVDIVYKESDLLTDLISALEEGDEELLFKSVRELASTEESLRNYMKIIVDGLDKVDAL
ncbi:MAG: hypothetical protein ACTSWV_01325 [Candidatus Asgardarchaeia archaeon]